MASYEIEVSRTAEKQLKKLPKEDRKRIVEATLELQNEPRPRGARKLSGYDDVYRIRVGRYRILYSVSETDIVIIILKIGRRKDVYR